MTSKSNSKLIGGEQEFAPLDLYFGTTNSGRSSLRWILESMRLKGKRILIPDYLCQAVVDVLEAYNIEVSFYTVLSDLSFDLSILSADVDALYVVRYFGYSTAALQAVLARSRLPLIIDDVFEIQPPGISSEVHWCYFNSLRKISAVADYSQVISNRPLSIISKLYLNDFTCAKYLAKARKYDFLQRGLGREVDYLDQFVYAEQILDTEQGIFEASAKSCYVANLFFQKLSEETAIRKANLELAKSLLERKLYIDIKPAFPSFLPLWCKRRDVVRKLLMEKDIFLAIHWPTLQVARNNLSDHVLSLPLDSRYNSQDIERVCNLLRSFAHE
ncbi:pyridoxal phosphate-dependent transferase [Alkalimonas sp. NCh-2]|uniref:pyridoxal phosphate-dependent transferase n=1 Tax=Alkalimonas sp. NCh-2 TaxID=3144846 RepID=UPI0031F68311